MIQSGLGYFTNGIYACVLHSFIIHVIGDVSYFTNQWLFRLVCQFCFEKHGITSPNLLRILYLFPRLQIPPTMHYQLHNTILPMAI
jgi:hypothetical protein